MRYVTLVCAGARAHREGYVKGKTCEMSSYTDFFSYTAMINLDPTTWRTRPSDGRPSPAASYKATFPTMTPTMKNRTTRASSRALGPSSLPAVATAGAGLLLCAVLLLRSPSSSCGRREQVTDGPRPPERALRPAWGLDFHTRAQSHDPVRAPHFEASEGTGPRPLRNTARVRGHTGSEKTVRRDARRRAGPGSSGGGRGLTLRH